MLDFKLAIGFPSTDLFVESLLSLQVDLWGLNGAWCWDKIVPLLKMKGHRVEASDLPGHGKDKTDNTDITSFL